MITMMIRVEGWSHADNDDFPSSCQKQLADKQWRQRWSEWQLDHMLLYSKKWNHPKKTTTLILTWKRTPNVASGALESHVGPPKDMLTCCLFELEVNIISYYHHDAGYHSHHHEYHHKPVIQVPAWIQSSSRHAEVAPASTKVRNCNYKINKIQQLQKWGIAITK